MGIASLVLGILLTLSSPVYIRLFASAVLGIAEAPALGITIIVIILGTTCASLFMGIQGKKNGKSCATAGIVLSAIPLAIQLFYFVLEIFMGVMNAIH